MTTDILLQRDASNDGLLSFSPDLEQLENAPSAPNTAVTVIHNRLHTPELESPHLWPSYELYSRHPTVPNFYVLPSFLEKYPYPSRSVHPGYQWKAVPPPILYPLPTPVYHHSPLPPYSLPTSQYHLQTPPRPERSRQFQHSTSPLSESSKTSNKIIRSKRKYEELFPEEQQFDRELSVFLDFDSL